MFQKISFSFCSVAILLCAMSVSAAEQEGLPLQASRTVEFTTDETTFTSLDVSPDGRSIVLEILGDLYELPIEGGQAASVTTGMAYDYRPRYSPDGDTIAFISDRSGTNNIWLYERDTGRVRMLTDNRSPGESVSYITPEWTPNGSGIITFAASGPLAPWLVKPVPHELQIIPLDGEVPKVLWTYEAAGTTSHVSECPSLCARISDASFRGSDQRYLYFARLIGGKRMQSELLFPSWQIYVRDVQTGIEYPQTTLYQGAFSPALSPDGKYMVYATRHGADTGYRVRTLDTGEDRWLAFPVDRDHQNAIPQDGIMPSGAFTPDSSAYVVSFGGKIWKIGIEDGELEEIPFEARVVQQLGPLLNFDYEITGEPRPVRQIRFPRVSPDGTRVAFDAMHSVWVMDIESGRVQRMTDEAVSAFKPVWSPDGAYLTYLTWAEPAGGHLYRVRADRPGEAERLTEDPAYYSTVEYTQDGQSLIALREPTVALLDRMARGTSGGPTSAQLIRLPTEGGRAETIALIDNSARNFGKFAHLHFAGDEGRIYFYEPGVGLVSIDESGNDRREHFDIRIPRLRIERDQEVNAEHLTDIVLSPDGSKALIKGIRAVYLLDDLPTMRETRPVPQMLSLSEADSARLSLWGSYLSWSDDGAAVYAHGNSIYIVPPDSMEPRRIEVDLTYEPAHPSGRVVLRNARLLTMSEAGVIENGDVLIRDNRVEDVGPSGEVRIPDGTKVIDLAGATIMPGMIDTHCHARPSGTGTVHSRQPWIALNYVAYGVTTCMDPAGTFEMYMESDMIAAGRMIGPRLMGGIQVLGYPYLIQDLDDAREMLRGLKVYDNYVKEYMSGDRRQRQWLAMAAKELEMTAVFEVRSVPYDMSHLIDGYSPAHGLLPGRLYRDFLEFIAQSGSTIHMQQGTLRYEGGTGAINYFITVSAPLSNDKLQTFTPLRRLHEKTLRRIVVHPLDHVFPLHARSARDIIEAGGNVSAGDHGEWKGIGMHWEVWGNSTGMPNLMALEIATLRAARSIGLEGKLGSIEAGKLADLIVINGNPLKNILETRKIAYVVKNGVIRDGATMDQVWPRQVPLPPQSWRDRTPEQTTGLDLSGGGVNYPVLH